MAGSGAENSKQAFEAGVNTHGPCSGPLLPDGAYLLEGPQPPKTRSPAKDQVSVQTREPMRTFPIETITW